MKKNLVILMALVLIVSFFTACGGSSDAKVEKQERAADRVLTLTYGEPPDSFNYLTSSKNSSFRHVRNFVSGLYANDQYGNYVPELAESYEVSDDGTVYTFHIRKGVKWYTATGEEYSEVKAQNWVASIKYMVENKSALVWLLRGVVKNFTEYEKGAVTLEDVGVKALDDYTLQYTLERPTPYFISLTLYSVMYPVDPEFLASKGADFGVASPENILYNGAFILSELTSKSKIAYIKNENYWDKDNVHFSEINFLYDDGKDPKSGINGFEKGLYMSSSLSPVWEDFDDYVEKYKDNAYPTMPNAGTFGFSINFNRRANKYTNKDAAGLKNTHDAFMNKNFRKGFQAVFSRYDYMRQTTPEILVLPTMHNIWTYADIVKTSKGESYGSLVNKEFNKLNDKQLDLSDGVNAYEDPVAGLKYLEKAKAEGVKFPVTLDILVVDNEFWLKRLKSLEQSIETNSNGMIQVDLFPMSPDELSTVYFRTDDPAQKDYDINYFIGWLPDFADPKNYLDIYNPEDGDFLKPLGLNHLGEDPENDKIMEELGLLKYNEMLKEANAEYMDLDKRYQLYAEAEAFLLENRIALPNTMDGRGLIVSKYVPFSGAYGLSTSGVWKYAQLQDEMVTVEQHAKAKAEWEAKKGK